MNYADKLVGQTTPMPSDRTDLEILAERVERIETGLGMVLGNINGFRGRFYGHGSVIGSKGEGKEETVSRSGLGHIGDVLDRIDDKLKEAISAAESLRQIA